MEILLAVFIVIFAVAGLSLGLLLIGRAPRTACDGLACLGAERCIGCPHRRRSGEADNG